MGRATRWLRNLLGGKKENRTGAQKEAPSSVSTGADHREKKRWSFGKLGRDSSDGLATTMPTVAAPTPPPAQVEKAWMRSYYAETEVEQSKHAIAVAAATAAAADAAVAAAHAAVAVVRLTSHGRGTMFGGGGERWAAIKIQTTFRGYLAKKALRALKALVKLQALVRGYLVRKQAAATLHSMQSLIRAQASVRAQRSRVLPVKDHSRFYPESHPRRSLEKFDETRSEHTASFHSRRLSASLEYNNNGFDESPKIVEIDTGRPRSRNRRLNPTASDSTTDESYSSPLPSQIPSTRLTIPDSSSDWCFTGDECRFSTAQSTPRFLNCSGPFTGVAMPVTPAKSLCGGDYNRRYFNHPNYMAKTESFNAKVRSQSAPKQRPEPRKKLSLSEIVESRASLSGVRMMRSCSRAQEAVSFKNTVVGRIDRSSELSRDSYERDYLQRRW